jgi:hypothetical protein
MKKLFWLVLVLSWLFIFPKKGLTAPACKISISPSTLTVASGGQGTFNITVTTGHSLQYAVDYYFNGTQLARYNQNFVANQPFTISYKVNGAGGTYRIDVYKGDVGESCSGEFKVITASPPAVGPSGGGDTLKDSPKKWLGLDPGFGIPKVEAGDFLKDKLVPFVVSLLIFGVIALSLIFTMVGGIMYMTSGGNKEGAAKAKNTITYALVGLVAGLGAFLISKILFTFLGM